MDRFPHVQLAIPAPDHEAIGRRPKRYTVKVPRVVGRSHYGVKGQVLTTWQPALGFRVHDVPFEMNVTFERILRLLATGSLPFGLNIQDKLTVERQPRQVLLPANVGNFFGLTDECFEPVLECSIGITVKGGITCIKGSVDFNARINLPV